ncbi:hypothetical protein [Candidatus Amarolinea dominans]|uniref:hypothetical protein n=1 Tax=Candidatus Amarolinea dominans TaxID=3140696 RepID=UPI001D8ABB22|nr:hypothetical protein [Anaerolineae bacterium]
MICATWSTYLADRLFLLLNIVSLDSQRWSQGENTAAYRRNWLTMTGLVALNLIVLNIWLYPHQQPAPGPDRAASTACPRPRDLLSNVQEPLLIRAYERKATRCWRRWRARARHADRVSDRLPWRVTPR